MATIASVRESVVEARVQTGLGTVALVREHFSAPIDTSGMYKDHHLQLTMIEAPYSPMGCFPDHWGPHRFERMGDLFMVPAHAFLRARSDCSNLRSIVCHLERDLVNEWFDSALEWTDQRLVGSLDITSVEVRRLMRRLADELQNPGFASAAMVELIVAQACIELSRYFRALDTARPRGGLAPWRARLINDALAHDPAGATLAQLASRCGLSVRHLTRAFRITHNRSLGEVIAEHRITLARRLLAKGGSVKEAAFATGFTAPTNFAAAFRRATGHTPRAYRNMTRD